MNDLEKRILLLEKAIGFEVGAEACLGDPNNCADQSCDLSRCPLMHNLVVGAYKIASDREKDYYVLRYLVETLMKIKDIPDEVVTLARKKAEKAALLRRRKTTTDMISNLVGNPTLIKVFILLDSDNCNRLDKLQEEIREMEKPRDRPE